MTSLGTIIGRGVTGSRPAASTPGALYFDTTRSVLQRDNGSTWDDVEGAGGGSSTLASDTDVSISSPAQGQVLGYDGAHWVNVGGIQKIAETIVGAGGVASVTFSSIPGTYRNLLLTVTGRGDTAAAITPVHAQFNSDSAGHYDEQEYYNSGASTMLADAAQAQTSGYVGYISAASDTSGFPGAFETTIYDYARTAWQKVWRGKSVIYETTAAGGITVLDLAGAWRSTAAITSITLLPGAGNFAQDTVLTLRGSA